MLPRCSVLSVIRSGNCMSASSMYQLYILFCMLPSGMSTLYFVCRQVVCMKSILYYLTLMC